MAGEGKKMTRAQKFEVENRRLRVLLQRHTGWTNGQINAALSGKGEECPHCAGNKGAPGDTCHVCRGTGRVVYDRPVKEREER